MLNRVYEARETLRVHCDLVTEDIKLYLAPERGSVRFGAKLLGALGGLITANAGFEYFQANTRNSMSAGETLNNVLYCATMVSTQEPATNALFGVGMLALSVSPSALAVLKK